MSDAKFREGLVVMRGGDTAKARATGNNAAWMCTCGKDGLPLVVTWFPAQSESVCPSCGRRYKFVKEAEPDALIALAATFATGRAGHSALTCRSYMVPLDKR